MRNWFFGLLLCVVVNNFIQANPLPANEVFELSAALSSANTLQLKWQIKPGYFLYRTRISVANTDDELITIASPVYPKPINKVDQEGRTVLVYRSQLILPISILGKRPGETLIVVHYQGCSDKGFCYPPESKQVKVSINSQLELSAVEVYEKITTPNLIGQPQKAKKDKIQTLLASNSLWMAIITFFGFGLLLSLTPCILPMVPVLSGIILGHSNTLSTRKAFGLSLSYVLSMALTYAIIGAVIAQLGSNLQITMQSPAAVSIFSLIFVVLAFSMLGYYDIKLPISWQNKLASINRSREGGHYLGAAVMGALSILILSPCVTPPLIGVLSYIAQSGKVITGSICLFFLGLGMGVPLLLIGISAGKFLPKAGNWMNGVKYFFGVSLLATAILLVSRIIPAWYSMILWSGLLVFSGVSINGFKSQNQQSTKAIQQTLSIMLIGYGLLILVGISMGSVNPLYPLQRPIEQQRLTSITSTRVKSLSQLNALIQQYRGKPIVLDFYADWCSSCKIIEATILREPKIVDALADINVIKIDLTQTTPLIKRLLNQYSVVAPPTFIFLDKAGIEVKSSRLVGEINSQQLLESIAAAYN